MYTFKIEITSRIKRCCRICLDAASQQELEDFVDMLKTVDNASGNVISLLDCFNSCTQINISEEDLNEGGSNEIYRYLCPWCKQKLLETHEFISKAQLNNELLQSRLTEIKDDLHEANYEKAENLSDVESQDVLDETPSRSPEVVCLIKDVLAELPPVDVKISEPLRLLTPDFNQSDRSTLINSRRSKKTFISVERLHRNAQMSTLHDYDNLPFICEENDGVSKLLQSEIDTEVNEITEETSKCRNFNYKCEFCVSQFEFERHLLRHYVKDHGDKNVRFSCELCTNSFINKRALYFHHRDVHEKCEYVDCLKCGRLVQKSFYIKHLRRHNRNVQFLCSQCPNTFPSRFALKKHMERHSRERYRKFQCLDCGRKFFTSDAQERHQLIHQDPASRKIFQCTICPKSFMLKANLQLHMQTHRGETISCAHCGKQFVRPKDLEIHIRFHTGEFPYACSFCDKKFAIKGHLTYHEKRHSGVRYKCKECEKTFINLSGLREHSFEHTAMPFLCGICQRGFPTLYKMRRHVRSLHPELFDNKSCSDKLVDQHIIYNQVSRLDIKSSEVEYIKGACADLVEMLEEHVDDIPKALLLA